jgi:hypothetical protein
MACNFEHEAIHANAISRFEYVGRVTRFDTGFLAHRHWMSRCFWLLCSTIFLRLMGGAAGLVHWNPAWTYPLSVWLSWIVPLAVYEIVRYSSKSIGNSTHIRV